MNGSTFETISRELADALIERRFGKIFQLSRNELAVDFRLPDSRYLYINYSPGDPRIHLITRRLKDLEKRSGNPSAFTLTLRKRLSGARVVSVERQSGERVVNIDLDAEDETGMVSRLRLVAQLTGRSANLFITDEAGIILDRARDTSGDGQQIGDCYHPPTRPSGSEAKEHETEADIAVRSSEGSPSEALDAYFAEREAERSFNELAARARKKAAADLRQKRRLLSKLDADLTGHGDAERWKRFGDLLLANASTGRLEGNTYYVTDFYDPDLAEVAIEVDENRPISESAEQYYRRYTKARNAAAEISTRRKNLLAEIEKLERKSAEIERAVEERDETFLAAVIGNAPAGPAAKRREKSNEHSSAVRSFTSSDGFEILVGKKATDNDVLTFKIAKSLDTWMHAADYPGSHVVIRNPNRVEIPQRTLLEAAQLAAFYSQGKTQVKAAVHYTQKKFVNKPKGAPPGLVSLSSFKTILVVPEFPAALDQA